LSPLYTRKGDEGYTGLLGKGRFLKNELRFDVLGAVDEATAALGLARSIAISENTISIILQVQRDLYYLMAEIADSSRDSTSFHKIDRNQVIWLESKIDQLEKIIKIPEEFILPGDSKAGAALDLARTIVRRAERHATELIHRGDVENVDLLGYLNRLSSLCFVLELYENQIASHQEVTLAKKKGE